MGCYTHTSFYFAVYVISLHFFPVTTTIISGSSLGAIILKPNSKLGWWETDLDSSSDTLTPQRANSHDSGSTSAALRKNSELAPSGLSSSAIQRGNIETAPSGVVSGNSLRTNTELSSPSKSKAATAAAGAAIKPLLPFSVTPPKPSGPSEAEMKLEALTASLEEELERAEQSEFFGECCSCGERVTGAGQACQVRVLFIAPAKNPTSRGYSGVSKLRE